LNSRKPHTTPQLCERTTFTKIINKNNEIAINTKEQTVVHHSTSIFYKIRDNIPDEVKKMVYFAFASEM